MNISIIDTIQLLSVKSWNNFNINREVRTDDFDDETASAEYNAYSDLNQVIYWAVTKGLDEETVLEQVKARIVAEASEYATRVADGEYLNSPSNRALLVANAEVTAAIAKAVVDNDASQLKLHI